MKTIPFSTLLGKTLTRVEQTGDDSITFTANTGERFLLYHRQGCCESVFIESVVGDLQDLVGHPITLAEEVTSGDTNGPDLDPLGKYDESYTWTFYKLATVKGYVDIRWYGTSNGYYSESVDFEKLN